MNITQSIAKAEHAAIVIQGMLEAVSHLCFDSTTEGIKERDNKLDRQANCFWWINDNYDCAASVTRAAAIIAESTSEILSAVWDELRKQEKDAG